jgi:hypothetical protein
LQKQSAGTKEHNHASKKVLVVSENAKPQQHAPSVKQGVGKIRVNKTPVKY